MQSVDNTENPTISNIPKVPRMSLIPNIPIINKLFINPETVVTKKFRCLNLASLSGCHENSLFKEGKDITIDTKIIEDFFEVKNEKKAVVKVSESKREDESPTLSSVIEKNRYTSIYISVNKLSRLINFEAMLEKIEDVFKENGEDNKEIFKILLSEEYERLFFQTFLNESEANLINSKNNLSTITQTECWLNKIAKNKNITLLIDNLFKLNMLIHTMKEESLNISKYITCYGFLINNNSLKILLNIILKIHNFLNKSSGKKEDYNFDIRNINNILSLKINNKQFTDILLKLYFNNTDKTISKSDLHPLHIILESDQVPMTLVNYSNHQISLEEIKLSISSLSINKHLLSHIEKIYEDLELSFLNIHKDIENEMCNRKLFLEYFSFPLDSKPEIINSIFSSSYTLLSKLNSQPKQSTPLKEPSPQPLTQRKNTYAKENNHRASNLINKYNLN